MGKRFILFITCLTGILLCHQGRRPIRQTYFTGSWQRFATCNLELIAERYNIDIAEAGVIQARLFENPVISLEQNVYNRLNGEVFRRREGRRSCDRD